MTNSAISLPDDEVLVITQTNFPEDFTGPQGLGGIIARHKADGTFKIRIKFPSGNAINAIPPSPTTLAEVVSFLEQSLKLYFDTCDDGSLAPLCIEHNYAPKDATADEFIAWLEENELGVISGHEWIN